MAEGPFRIRDKKTGHEYTVTALYDDVPKDSYEVLDTPAVDDNGRFLPAVLAQPKAIDDLTVDELKAKADSAGVDLGGATKKADIAAKITQAEEANK